MTIELFENSASQVTGQILRQEYKADRLVYRLILMRKKILTPKILKFAFTMSILVGKFLKSGQFSLVERYFHEEKIGH